MVAQPAVMSSSRKAMLANCIEGAFIAQAYRLG
jgi:hypothetical protein